MKTLLSKVVLTLVLVVVYFFIFLRVTDFTDRAYFGGDTWEYQSLAVNFVHGQGISAFGEFVPFEEYRFSTPKDSLNVIEKDSELRQRFINIKHKKYFYRTPGYTLFLGGIYTLFGVSPLNAKQIQLLLLIIVASCLPWIGKYYWGSLGFFSGLIASPISIASTYRFSDFILTESLTVLMIFFIVVTYTLFVAKKTWMRAILLGLVLGAGILVKGTLVFILPLIVAHVLFTYVQTRKKRTVSYLCITIIMCAAVIVPWSMHASSQLNRVVFLSTEENAALLDAHNEYALDGIWHPEWRDEKESFYNNDGLEEVSSIVRVANFYLHHPEVLPIKVANSLTKAYRPLKFFWIALALFVITHLFGYFRRTEKNTQLFSIPPIFAIVFLNFLIITVLFYPDGHIYPSRLVKVMDFLFILCAVHFALALLVRICSFLKNLHYGNYAHRTNV